MSAELPTLLTQLLKEEHLKKSTPLRKNACKAIVRPQLEYGRKYETHTKDVIHKTESSETSSPMGPWRLIPLLKRHRSDRKQRRTDLRLVL